MTREHKLRRRDHEPQTDLRSLLAKAPAVAAALAQHRMGPEARAACVRLLAVAAFGAVISVADLDSFPLFGATVEASDVLLTGIALAVAYFGAHYWLLIAKDELLFQLATHGERREREVFAEEVGRYSVERQEKVLTRLEDYHSLHKERTELLARRSHSSRKARLDELDAEIRTLEQEIVDDPESKDVSEGLKASGAFIQARRLEKWEVWLAKWLPLLFAAVSVVLLLARVIHRDY